MKAETLVAAVSFTCFGVLIGWILGSQQVQPPVDPPAATSATSAPASAPASSPNGPAPQPVDAQRVADLERTAHADASNASVRVQLGNLYFDAQRFDLAIPWYEAAFALTPRDADVSTDLAVCYYYSNQVDRALAQLDRSLAIDPHHAKALLNQGIVRAWGKSDLQGAVQSWQKVVDVAPGTDEAKEAQRALDDVKSAHAGGMTGGTGGGRSGG